MVTSKVLLQQVQEQLLKLSYFHMFLLLEQLHLLTINQVELTTLVILVRLDLQQLVKQLQEQVQYHPIVNSKIGSHYKKLN